MRWAVFKDYRGVAYCELVDEGMAVWILDVPARKRKLNFFGQVKQEARAAERRQKVVFDPDKYSRDRYYESAFAPAPEGYTFRDDIRYLEENRWGAVQVILFIKDDNLGRRMQYEFRRLAPEHELYNLGGKRDHEAEPHPDTDRIIEKLKGAIA